MMLLLEAKGMASSDDDITALGLGVTEHKHPPWNRAVANLGM